MNRNKKTTLLKRRMKSTPHPRKQAFFVSQKSLTPTCGNISFWRISFAYLIRFSFVTPGRAPLAPIKFSATFCSWTTNASSKDGFTYEEILNHGGKLWLNISNTHTTPNKSTAPLTTTHFVSENRLLHAYSTVLLFLVRTDCEIWWLSGKFGALRPVGCRFESHSSRYIGTLGKSFTHS